MEAVAANAAKKNKGIKICIGPIVGDPTRRGRYRSPDLDVPDPPYPGKRHEEARDVRI